MKYNTERAWLFKKKEILRTKGFLKDPFLTFLFLDPEIYNSIVDTVQLRKMLKGIQLPQIEHIFSLLLQGVCWTVRHRGARLMCHPVTPQWAGSTEDCQEVTQRAITNAILISSHPVSYAPHPVTSTIYQVSSQAGIVKSDLVEKRNERAVVQIRGKRFSPFPLPTSRPELDFTKRKFQ